MNMTQNKLPKKWYIKVTDENREMLNKFKLSKSKIQIINYDYVCYKGFGWYHVNNPILQTYTEITTEQFKQLVLKESNMEQKEIKIQIPEGYEIDKELSTFAKIVFKAKVKELPKSWEELVEIGGYYLSSVSNATKYATKMPTSRTESFGIWPTKEYAEASIALAQLLQLRKVYNAGWEPDWTDGNCKHCIYIRADKIQLDIWRTINFILAFKTGELAQQFLTNFKDLIEIAKPLL